MFRMCLSLFDYKSKASRDRKGLTYLKNKVTRRRVLMGLPGSLTSGAACAPCAHGQLQCEFRRGTPVPSSPVPQP